MEDKRERLLTLIQQIIHDEDGGSAREKADALMHTADRLGLAEDLDEFYSWADD